ncbi:acyl-CoA N-acyltransferase [Russula ochroleuca]|uniref:Acyl-CoA N-acyltransferase n=1 Tax=Russula ochroleuca TaxID=152965 RepID=A0A9P5MT92_9AGAM|nr:acyl-CoA N-acyltransferase [Russula ochroleuca]
MRLNAHTAIVGETVVLVPYRVEHVEKYHTWMQSEELRELTASEELTLEQEYTMQRSWQEDEDKLTFIVLARPLEPSDADLTNDDIKALLMIGDVNLFFKNTREDPEFEVECEVMIAEPIYRGQRRAHAALILLLSYACDKLGVRKESFVARIGSANTRSIALFTSLGFEVVRTVSVFDQVEMRVADSDAESWPSGLVREYP